MLKIGQKAEVEITGYSSDGLGVCRIDGCAVFVPNAIRGERCEISVTHVSRNSAHGKIDKILEKSPHRIPRACPVAKLCGGCQYHHMDYAEELYAKAQKVTDALNRIGGQSLPPVPITGGDGLRRLCEAAENREPGTGNEPVCRDGTLPSALPLRSGEGPEAVYAYRNKAQYPVSEKNGRPIAGFYKNRTHEVIPVERCAILPEVFDRVKDLVLRWAAEDGVSVYDERSGKGLLRHIYVRRGAVTGELMVCLVVNGEGLPREKRLVHTLRREIPGLASVVLSENTKNTNVVLGDKLRTLWGRDWIEDELCGFRFRLSPRSFYQVNHDQAQRLYEKAVELAGLHGTETVLDLYCGTGTITLALSRKAGKAVGVEIIPQAIEDAKENARRNGVTNVEFFCADASEAAKRFAAQAAGSGQQATGEKAVGADGHIVPACPDEAAGGGQQATGDGGERILRFAQNDRTGSVDGGTDPSTPLRSAQDDSPAGINVIVVDPPRKGLAPDVIDAMVRMAPQRIVYVSCDPATLARDVKLLTEKGYALTHAEAFDLFPRTFHVETVVQLSKGNISTQNVRVEFSLEDMDMSGFQQGATYEQIQEWIQEKYGFHVTHLNIAKTKRKCGIIERQNYNLAMSENSRSPDTPKEKEEAIIDAFLYFKMM